MQTLGIKAFIIRITLPDLKYLIVFWLLLLAVIENKLLGTPSFQEHLGLEILNQPLIPFLT